METTSGPGVPDQARARLAGLIVDALGIGTTKREWDVVDELFAAFGAVVPELPDGASPDDVAAWRATAAQALGAAASTPAALLNQFVRCGGRFVDMLEEIYDHLAQHAVTAAREAETFRLRRDEIDDDGLTLSPAFLEEVRRLERRTGLLRVGRIDDGALARLISSDGGELYGRWPVPPAEKPWQWPPVPDPGIHLADAVLHLAWLPDGLDLARPALDRAREAAERMVVAAEDLLRGYTAMLGTFPEQGPVDASALLTTDLSDRELQRANGELEAFREHGVIGIVVHPGLVTAIDEECLLGVDRDGRPVTVTGRHGAGTGAGQLAGFVAMWRTGRWAPRRQQRLLDDLRDDGAAHAWLDSVATAADEAAQWLRDDVVVGEDLHDVEALVEVVEDYLNLPLWRRRDFLYEVWVLVATLRAAQSAGWVSELVGLSGDVWQLPARSAEPVARLRSQPTAPAELAVWREPVRVVGDVTLTPDLTVTTTGDFPRDLLVVEAKDRTRMPGVATAARGSRRRARATTSALDVARRYARTLGATATWVCNHCELLDPPDPATNLGDPWTAVHLASAFRPRTVPQAFEASVAAALRAPRTHPDPPADRTESPAPRPARALTVVIDRTASMIAADVDWEGFRRATATAGTGPFRAVLYSDHGAGEPFLVRKVGPCATVDEIVDAVRTAPVGSGGDRREALEDALQRCREIQDDVGPHDVLVVTDAPPHRAHECPYGVDYETEVLTLLSAGSRVMVASDWQDADDVTWIRFAGMDGFHRAPMTELLTHLGTDA